jgi:hypothetical protein
LLQRFALIYPPRWDNCRSRRLWAATEREGNPTMSISDDGRPASKRRRNRIAVSAGAAVVLLGAGAYVVAGRSGGDDTAVTGEAPVLSAPSASSAPSSSPAPVAAPSSASAAPRTSPPAAHSSPTADAAKVRKQVMEAREKAARDGIPLQRPLATSTAAIHDASSYAEQTRPLPGGGTMRVMSARYDLSGQREMLWAADRGSKVGDVRCTQNFHFSATGRPAIRPTMLLCWRTSSDRSVVVLTVAKSPSMKGAADVIDEKWASLG